MHFLIVCFSVLIKLTVQSCDICQRLVEEFNHGLHTSEKSNFGGGNTAWEEEKLGNFAISETRLVHIIENLCPPSMTNKEKCQYFREEAEDKIEEWWFQVFRKDPISRNLYDFLCVDRMGLCCPVNHFGPSCQPCDQIDKETGLLCGGHGSCEGNATRLGDGSCRCFTGYDGLLCESCADNYYRIENNDCVHCDLACANCSGPGSDKCVQCAQGFAQSTDGLCTDINECDSKSELCNTSEYCENVPGSFKCFQCDSACSSCIGNGPRHCTACNSGYQRIGDTCEDINECSADSELCRDVGQKCTNLPGSFSCECADNYVKQSDGSCVLNESSKRGSSSSKTTTESSSYSSKSKANTKSKNKKQPKKIWTKKFEREFFKLICCICLLAITSYFFGNNSTIIMLAAIICGYYVYNKSIKLDQIFSKSVIL